MSCENQKPEDMSTDHLRSSIRVHRWAGNIRNPNYAAGDALRNLSRARELEEVLLRKEGELPTPAIFGEVDQLLEGVRDLGGDHLL